MTCFLHDLNYKVHNRVKNIENSIQSALKIIVINLGLPLRPSYEIVLKK